MTSVKKLVLDVLKPHHPTSIEFSRAIAEVGQGYCVTLTVVEIDEETETLEVIVEGSDLDFEAIQSSINEMGGSLHSVDTVIVRNESDNT